MRASATPDYAVVTPIRNEAANLPRLAQSLAGQTVRPAAWVVVDTGSTDDTPQIAAELEREHSLVVLLHEHAVNGRGGPIVRAFNRGVAALPKPVQIVVKVDADVWFPPTYFESLLERFEVDPTLGIASGICVERDANGRWRPRQVTGGHVWGAARAYRLSCLERVSPLEERMGWDGIDVLKAQARGWTTCAFSDLEFRHYRGEGERESSARVAWAARGRAAHYMGYRPSYLVLRSLHYAIHEPAALAMLAGWSRAFIQREPQCSDQVARRFLRRQQSLRALPRRAREALGLATRR